MSVLLDLLTPEAQARMADGVLRDGPFKTTDGFAAAARALVPDATELTPDHIYGVAMLVAFEAGLDPQAVTVLASAIDMIRRETTSVELARLRADVDQLTQERDALAEALDWAAPLPWWVEPTGHGDVEILDDDGDSVTVIETCAIDESPADYAKGLVDRLMGLERITALHGDAAAPGDEP